MKIPEVKSKPLNFIRYGVSKKKELLEEIKTIYDGLVLPANILLYQYKSTPILIHNCKDKLFFIDPMSYLFGKPFDEFKRFIDDTKEFKPSFEKLMQYHGLDTSYFIDRDYNDVLNHLTNKSNLQTFVNNCLDFQIHSVSDNLTQYASGLIEGDLDFNSAQYKPSFLIPPYFLFEKDQGSSEINFMILDYTKQMDLEIDVYPMVFITKEILNSSFLNSIIEKIKSYNFPGYCLWIDSFRESKVDSVEKVKATIELVDALSNNNSKNVIMMYGGYFSLSLFSVGVRGVCHGTLFSESRGHTDSVRKSSGPAPIRYYIHKLHELYPLETAIKILEVEPDLHCNCQVCNRVVKNIADNIATFLNNEELAELHFLRNRFLEKQELSNRKLSEIATDLKDVSNKYKASIEKIMKTVQTAYGEDERQAVNLDYIDIWSSAMEQFIK